MNLTKLKISFLSKNLSIAVGNKNTEKKLKDSNDSKNQINQKMKLFPRNKKLIIKPKLYL